MKRQAKMTEEQKVSRRLHLNGVALEISQIIQREKVMGRDKCILRRMVENLVDVNNEGEDEECEY